MQPARFRGVPGLGHGLRHRRGEGDDVVLHFGFDFVDARHVEAGMQAQQACRLGRHHAQLGQRLGCRQLHFQPLLKPVLVVPDPAHFGPRVSRDHKGLRRIATDERGSEKKKELFLRFLSVFIRVHPWPF